MEPYSEMLVQALFNFWTQVTSIVSFAQQENDEVGTEMPTVVNDLLDDDENDENNVMPLETQLNLLCWMTSLMKKIK